MRLAGFLFLGDLPPVPISGATHGRFIVRSNGGEEYTVVDLMTGLEFDSQPFPEYLTWEETRQHCEDLQWGGHDDWRLPTFEEVTSLPLFIDEADCYRDCGTPCLLSTVTALGWIDAPASDPAMGFMVLNRHIWLAPRDGGAPSRCVRSLDQPPSEPSSPRRG